VSLRRKAAITAAFGYLQFGISIVTGLFLVPLTLHSIGARTWGVWLASGEVLAYAGMADLGMLAVMQWLIAEAEGRKDRREMANLVSQGIWLGTAVGIVFVSLAFVLWRSLPSVLFLTAADRAVIERPLLLAVVLTASSYPLLSYRALLIGIQDASFLGTMSVINATISAAVLAGMLLGGWGLYALVWSSIGTSLIVGAVLGIRAAMIAPDVVYRIAPPQTRYLRTLLTNGVGAWLGNIGWQTLAATNSVLITYIGHPEWVPVYACTAKVANMAMPLTWILPDAGHVSLAQLHGEGSSQPRVRDVINLMQRLHLVLAGLVAVGLLGFNGVFVTHWVGAPFFGGIPLNAVVALGVIVHSFTHGFVTSSSIAGSRPRVGALVLINGAVQLPLGIVLGHRMGLIGIPVAGLVAAALTSLPGSIALLRHAVGYRPSTLLPSMIGPWISRALAPLAAALFIGAAYPLLGIWICAAATVAACLAYVWLMRPLYGEGLPLEANWMRWLRLIRLLPESPIVPPAIDAVDNLRAPL